MIKRKKARPYKHVKPLGLISLLMRVIVPIEPIVLTKVAVTQSERVTKCSFKCVFAESWLISQY
jgi:hypothetical protein